MITESRIDKCIETMWAIAHSPKVQQYIIGRTSRSAAQKGDNYRSDGFEHLVVLADRMNDADAKKLERELQEYAWSKKTPILYAKYHLEKRDGRSYPSDGNTKVPKDSPVHSVYMAWLEPSR